mmetsp:Transcript_123413/g.356767  ORF Transcript_123413/g.356767 Transcript_123413/m.356767 type:complete len:270 (+) Transcript_123413:355-1164(+)
MPPDAQQAASMHERRHHLGESLLDADGHCGAEDQVEALEGAATDKAEGAMLGPDLPASADEARVLGGVVLHLRLHVVACHVEDGQVGPQRRGFKGEKVGLVLLLQTPQPCQVLAEPLGRPVRRLVDGVMQQALPLEERVVPGKVPHPQRHGSGICPAERAPPSVPGDAVGLAVAAQLAEAHVHAEALAPAGRGGLRGGAEGDADEEPGVRTQPCLPKLAVQVDVQRDLDAPVDRLTDQSHIRPPHPEETHRRELALGVSQVCARHDPDG